MAGGVLAIFLVIVLVFMGRSPSSAAGGPSLPISAEPAPDIKQLPAPGGVSSVAGGGQFFAQIVAKDDPTRLVGEISSERYEPLEAHRFKLEKPQGWAFLKSGRTVHVQADRGRTYMPDQGPGARPHDAVLDGNVVIKIFEARPDGHRPNLATDEPLGTATCDTLNFDGELGEVKVPGRLVLTSKAADFTGSDVTVLFNDVQQRIELLHVVHTESLVLKPDFKPEPSAAPAPPPSALASAPPAAPSGGAVQSDKTPRPKPASEAPTQTLYHLVCTGNVVASQASRKVEAEQLDGWTRLIGNALRPGAIASSNAPLQRSAGPSQPGQSAPQDTTPPQPGSAPAAAGPPPPSVITDSFPSPNDNSPVTLTWTGPMEVRPLSDAPGELTYNDVFLRFTGATDGSVRLADESSKATAAGSLVEYGATRREAALAAKEPMGAVIMLPGSGNAKGRRFEMSMATGVAHAPYGGVITAENAAGLPGANIGESNAGEPQARSLSWSQQAEFRFLMNDKHEVTPVISEVHADGAATATDGKGSLSGASLIALFKPVTPKASRLDHLQVVGQATGQDGKGNGLSSDTLEVTFVPSEGKPDQSDPNLVTANGNVQAHKKSGPDESASGPTVPAESALTCEFLEARLARTDKHEIGVTRVIARNNVAFQDGTGVGAKAAQLDADPIAQTARLTGPDMGVELSKEGTTIRGQDVQLRSQDRGMHVSGAGTLVHDGPLSEKPGEDKSPVHADVRWTQEMDFVDATGQAFCTGDVEAVVTKPARPEQQAGPERDTMIAEEVQLTFTPAPQRSAENDKQASDPSKQAGKDPANQRRLLSVRGIGTLATDPKGQPAKVESCRYASTPGPQGQAPAIERRLHLQSARINADNEKGTLDTPTPGKLLVEDHRAAAAAPSPAKDTQLNIDANARGTTLFTWKGAMSLNRADGVVHLNDGVWLKHQDEGQADGFELECENLTANFRELTPPNPTDPGQASPTEPLRGELTSSDAVGAVVLSAGARELVCDSLHYDAVKKLILARANEGNVVTLFDPKKTSAPVTARELEWDRAADRIRIIKPGSIVTPR
jgi:hypothetical protein